MEEFILNNRCTIRDIAHLAQVSTSTVHKAIYGKPGVGEEVRQKILRIAEENHYTINPTASNLKRGLLNAVVALPQLPKSQDQFYRGLWRGIDNSEPFMRDRNVMVLRMSCGQNAEEQMAALEEVLAMTDVDGMITYCWDDQLLNPYFERLHERGIPVVTVEADAPDSCRAGCVTIDAERSGRLVAETMGKMLKRQGQLLLLSGFQPPNLLRDKAYGFSTYAAQHLPGQRILQLYSSSYDDDLENIIFQELHVHPDIAGVYCATGSAGLPMCRALHRAGVAGQVVAVASDAYEELLPYLEDGTVHATVWQAPEQQAENALLLLYDFMTGRAAGPVIRHVPLGILFQNNCSYYI
jgi:LacI family transcriptional regulator